MNYWFTSDNHFFHKNILLKFCPDTRQGANVGEMNELMVERWNDVVRDNDVVFCNGDFSFGRGEETGLILDRLRGRKKLVLGNHENYLREMGRCRIKTNIERWESIEHHDFMKLDGQQISLFHYPIWEWRNMHRGAFHFYGHVHGKPMGIPGRCMDIGIDTRPNKDMTLWPWEELKTLMLAKEVRGHH